MSDVLEYVLNGLEQALELERELGVRSVEIDRGLLEGEKCLVPSAIVPSAVVPRASGATMPATSHQPPATVSPAPATSHQALGTNPSLVFIHDRPLSPGGVEMMAKIVTALGLTVDKAPVVVAPPIPNANIFVFLGFAALKRYMPSVRLEENAWGKSPKGKDVLLVKSPEEILRFATVTPAVKKMKEDMWRSLKAVKQRLLV